MKVSVILVAAIVVSVAILPTAEAEAVTNDDADDILFPWVGEELYYTVRVNDSEALRAGIRIGDIQHRDRRPYIPINGIARSRGFLDSFYPIDDRANTYLCPRTLTPLRSENVFDENGRFRSYDVDYQHHAFTAAVERHREDRESRYEFPIPDQTHNMITWMYEIRQIDDVSLGDRYTFYVYDGWLLSHIILEVVGREDVLTPMGWFKTWKLSFTRQIKEPEDMNSDSEPAPPQTRVKEEARHTGHLWLSRDANKLPVKVTIDTGFGPAEVLLVRYQPGTPR